MPFFSKRSTHDSRGQPEFLIVGLGNPGKKYEFTRHNAGFLCVELLAEKLNIKINRLRFKSLLGFATAGGRRCVIMKPQTFMNNSGEAVRQVADFYKIPVENIIVIFDDASLPPGRLRIRRKGSSGGHNGIKSIIAHLHSDNFPRIKLGIGASPYPGGDLIDWVLSSFNKEELKLLRAACDNACEAAEMIVEEKVDEAMNRFNS